jgi:sec-independent protein translocase protein TatC
MDNSEQTEFGFLDHLEELRAVLLRIVVLVVILFPVCLYFAPQLLDFIVAHLDQPGFKLKYFSPLEPFWVMMKISFFCSVVLALPVIFWQIWRFIAPGLYQKERSFVIRLTASAMVLFVLGAVFSAVFILPLMIRFSMSFASESLEPAIGLEKFIGLVLMLIFGFGLMFEFPIAIFMLVRSGLVELDILKKQRPVIVIIILFLSAVLTPPDVLSQLLMGVPTYLLFELSLLFARPKKKLDSEEPASMTDDETKSSPETKESYPDETKLPEIEDYFDYESDPLPRKSRPTPGRSPASCVRKRRRRK